MLRLLLEWIKHFTLTIHRPIDLLGFIYSTNPKWKLLFSLWQERCHLSVHLTIKGEAVHKRK